MFIDKINNQDKSLSVDLTYYSDVLNRTESKLNEHSNDIKYVEPANE